MDIYIKPVKKIIMTERDVVYLSDVAKVYAPDDILDKVKKTIVFKIKDKEKKANLLSVIDIINAIDKSVPGYTINNVGEKDIIVDYTPNKKRQNVLYLWLRIAFVSLILLAGSTTAIMSFHSDSQIPTVFKNYTKLFFGEEKENSLIIDLPYSFGLAVGIIIFFNHIAGKKITEDPTPIQVEMTTYEINVNETIVDALSAEEAEEELDKTNKDK